MKKIFTLLVVTSVMLTTAFAQNGRNDKDWNDVAMNNGNSKYDKDDAKFFAGKYYFTPRERDMEIAKIKREYDYKIQAVKSKYFMSQFQKKRQIEFLKDQREKEIARVIFKFNDRRNQFGDHGRDKGKHW